MTFHREVGKVVGLFRYPVKSMAAESLEAVDVGWNGFAGDRRWAFVRDNMVRSDFPWLTIRERPEMWKYVPRFVNAGKPDSSEVTVRTPSGNDLDVADPALAAELGDGARVIRQGRGIFDTMPLSLITSQTITELGSIVGSDLGIQRFRPNIVIDARDLEAFAEDEWVGAVLRIGGMQMRVDKRDKRCVVINVDPVSTTRDPAILRAVARERQACLGVYGSTVAPGKISVGDAVLIEVAA